MTQKRGQDVPAPPARMVERLLFGCRLAEIPRLIPGLLMAVGVVAVAIFVASFLNRALGFNGLVSYILIAIMLGILVSNLVPLPASATPGIGFAVKKALRLGIILLGIRLSIFDVLKVGALGIPIVLVCIFVGLVATWYFSRLFRIPGRLAALIAVGTGICGISAIVATAPGIDARDEEVSYAVANITVFGMIALATYPFISHLIFNGNTTMVGLFLGTAVHDTSQVTASGMVYDQTFGVSRSPTALDVATVTKLVRNVMMALIIPAIGFVYAKRNGQASRESGLKKVWKLFPLFILGFLFLAVLRSAGDAAMQGGGAAFGLLDARVWAAVRNSISDWSGYVLATAVAGVGLSTSFKSMRGLGIRPFYVGLFAATTVGIAAFILVSVLGRFVGT